jgi:hypothetical protein
MWSEVSFVDTDFQKEFKGDLSYLLDTNFVEYRSTFNIEDCIIPGQENSFRIEFPVLDKRAKAMFWKIHGENNIKYMNFNSVGLREEYYFKTIIPFQYFTMKNSFSNEFYSYSFALHPTKFLENDTSLKIGQKLNIVVQNKDDTIDKNTSISVIYQILHSDDFMNLRMKNYCKKKKESFKDIHQELIVKTWHPDRIELWCM